ncbi:MAG: hypothetical protein ACI841_002419 [Planctomycetota bacterium]|jgi:hypothetical protein
MHSRTRLALSLSLLSALALSMTRAQQSESTDPAVAAQVIDPNPLLRMDWLAGTWSGPMWDGTFEAHYSTPAGGRILSHSRLFLEDQVRFYEFEVFEFRNEVATLAPHPQGKALVGFELSELSDSERKATFENPDKDFPTRIVYHRVDDDQLVITLTDPHGESDRVETFKLQR